MAGPHSLAARSQREIQVRAATAPRIAAPRSTTKKDHFSSNGLGTFGSSIGIFGMRRSRSDSLKPPSCASAAAAASPPAPPSPPPSPSPVLPKSFRATTGVSATVGGKRIGDAA